MGSAASCLKGSCQRHGKCMYLNHPRCPLAHTPPDADQKRRDAITAWWERQSVLDFIARVRSKRHD